jgi:hypothetical protein
MATSKAPFWHKLAFSIKEWNYSGRNVLFDPGAGSHSISLQSHNLGIPLNKAG